MCGKSLSTTRGAVDPHLPQPSAIPISDPVGCWHTITGPENRDAKRQSPPSGPANSLEAGLHDTRNHPEPAGPLQPGLTFSTSCQRITAAGALQELSLEYSSVSLISRACHCEQILMGYTPQVTPPPLGGGDTLSHFSNSHSWSQSADGHGNAPREEK